jgi:hypothetical protein
MKTDNQKKYRLIVLLLIIVNVLIVFAWWYLDNDNPDGQRKRQRGREEFKKDFFESTLKLDSSQRCQFKQLNHSHFKSLGELNNDIDSLKLLIKDEIINPTRDEKRVKELFSEIVIKRTVIDTTIYNHFKQLRLVCHPDQVASFDSLTNSFFLKKERFPGQGK